jgi:hypothetical protein
MKIYVVESGYYSDKDVVGVYSTLEKAKEAAKIYAANEGIEEWELDALPEGHRPGLFGYEVSMSRDGNHHSLFRTAPSTDDGWFPFSHTSSELQICFTLNARDDEHALKIANERRAMLIALNLIDIPWSEYIEKDRPIPWKREEC